MKPRLLIRTMDLNRNIDGIDFIEMIKIPYNFKRLKDILQNNYEEFESLVDSFERCGWYNLDQIEDFKLIIETVKELNMEYLPIEIK